MNPDLDPMNVGKQHKSESTSLVPSNPQNVQQVEKPKNLPQLLNRLVRENTIGGDLCRYFIFPAIETGAHKALSALLSYFVLGQDIRPANGKGNNTYVYMNSDGHTDYTGYYASGGKTQATFIDSSGTSHTMSSGKNTSGTMSVFKLQHYADDDMLKVNPIPWTWADVEAKQEKLNDDLSEAIYNSQWASVQDAADSLGVTGVPPTANKWGWKNISKMSVQIDPDDPTILVVRMGLQPQPIN